VRRLLALLGLATALLLGVDGVMVLATPAPTPPVDVVDAVLPMPELPNDLAMHVAMPAPATLVEGTRIRISRLGIDLPLESGDLDRDIAAQLTPVGAAFLLPGSAVPGTGGNAYVYSHARVGMFLTLWNASLGDVVEVVSPSGAVLRYTITEIHSRVPTSDIEFVLPTSDERLTLQTSTGPHVTDPRFVVVARPTN